jgi:predicted PurR-regulated permease PerM
MRFALQVAGWAFGLPLEILIIAALLRGGYRRFPFIFLYIVCDFITTVLEMPASISYVRGGRGGGEQYAGLYWIDEVILQVLIYAVVMSLVYGATRRLRSRRIVRTSVIAGALLIAGISFGIHYRPGMNKGSYMTPWTRDLNFSSAMLDLGLWALLIGSRTRDHQTLLLSGALGIKFAGESIGESVRQLAIRNHSRPISLTGNVIIMLANIFFFYVWWQALRDQEERKEEPPARQAAP